MMIINNSFKEELSYLNASNEGICVEFERIKNTTFVDLFSNYQQVLKICFY